MLVRMIAWTGDATNTPAVEPGYATAATGGNHRQRTAATGWAAGITWRRRRFAGHGVRYGRMWYQWTCPRADRRRAASDRQYEQACACTQRSPRPEDIHKLKY
jgi:hypothetical protein